MARRILLQATRGSLRLSRHLLARRALRQRMHHTTPIRFLRRLNLFPDVASFEMPLSRWWMWEPFVDTTILDTGALEILDSPPARGPADVVRTAVPPPHAVEGPTGVAADAAPRMFLPPVARPEMRPEVASRVSATRVVPSSRRDVAAETERTDAALSARVAGNPDVARAPDSARVNTPANSGELEATPPLPLTDDRDATESVSLEAFSGVEPPASEPSVMLDVLRSPGPSEPALVATGQEGPLPTATKPPSLVTAAPQASVQGLGSPTMDIAEADGIEEPPALAPSVELAPDAPGEDQERLAAAVADSTIEDVIDTAIERAIEPATTVTPATVVGERPARAEAPRSTPNRRARVEELPREHSDARRSANPEAPPSDRSARSRKPSPPSAPAEREGDRLFQPVDPSADIPPAVWAERLAKALRAPAPAAPVTKAPIVTPAPRGAGFRRPVVRGQSAPVPPQSPAPRASAAPLSRVQVSETARRFLEPLVGVDPATVTVVQGPAADAVTAASQTDALAIGDETIVVGPTFTGEMPRDLGLLAHELTHIARERRPRFVPPAARAVPRIPTAQPSEESIARRVESRMIALAHDGAARRAMTAVDRGVSRERSPQHTESTPVEQPVFAAKDAGGQDWGGLPAPWEPLPAWFTESASAGAASSTSLPPSAQVPFVAPIASISAPIATVVTSSEPLSVHGAETGRAVDAAEPAGSAPGGDGQAGVAPDLDQLARQVYAALKRRLEADARRERMF